MTTPGGQYPDDTLGDDLSPLQGITQESWERGVRNKAIAPYNNGHNNLADLLGSILQNLARAAMQGLGAIAEGFANLFGAVVEGIGNFLNGLTAAILGQNPSGQVPPSVGSSFADIRDGQRALIGKINQLGDNAGFCNLVMSKNWRLGIQGVLFYKQKWLGHDYDTYVTQCKNAHKEMINVPNSRLPTEGIPINGYSGMRCTGIVFDAPGVWSIDALNTVSIRNASGKNLYFESSIFVFKLSPNTGPGGYREASEVYSETRLTGVYTPDDVLSGLSNTKSVLIPKDDNGNVEGDGFVAITATRVWESTIWGTSGGSVYSQFTANRLSTDATYFEPSNNASGTVQA